MNKRPKRPKTSDEVAEMLRTGRKIDAAVRRAIHAVTRPKKSRSTVR